MARNTAICWQDIEIMIEPHPFCKLCQISTINKKARLDTHLKAKKPFKWVFMDTIPVTYYKSLSIDSTFSNYLLFVDEYSKIPKLYEM